MFMLRYKQWKLVAYPGHAYPLFDLHADPEETQNLVDDPARADQLANMTARLNSIIDPVAINALALSDQV